MTYEQMQRTMEFIVEQQAQFTASMQRREEERVRDAPRLARLEQSFQTLVELAQNTDWRLDRIESGSSVVDARLGRLEFSFEVFDTNMVTLQANMTALAASQAQTDGRLRELIEVIRESRNGKT